MLTSQRELLGLASAAATGMGYPYGIGDDLARAVVWLVVRDADGLGALMTSTPRTEPIAPSGSGPVSVDGVHVGSDGSALLDLLIANHRATRNAGGERMSLRLRLLDSPLLLIGLAGTAAEIGDPALDFLVGEGSGASASVATSALTVSGAADAALIGRFDLEAMGMAVEISCRTGGPSGGEAPQPTRLIVGDDRWTAAEELAHRTYVPASEHSRHSGAGAGLTDND